MKKQKMTGEIYTFEDVTVYTIRTPEEMTVYTKGDGILLDFCFSVKAEDADSIDIEALHANGYFVD